MGRVLKCVISHVWVIYSREYNLVGRYWTVGIFGAICPTAAESNIAYEILAAFQGSLHYFVAIQSLDKTTNFIEQDIFFKEYYVKK